MISWGLVSMATMFVRGPATFMAARVLLGIAEAGFFPGMVLFFTYWFPASERARTGALFMMASPVAVIIGAPLSTAVLRLDGIAGLRGWQWLFLVEGLPAVVLGFVDAGHPDRSPRGGALAVRTPIARGWHAPWPTNRRRRQAAAPTSIRWSLANPQLWLLCAVFFLNSIVNYGMFLWLPKLLEDVTGARGFALSVITTIPFIGGAGGDGDRRARVRSHGRAQALRRGLRLATAVGLVIAVVVSATHVAAASLGFAVAQMALRSLAGVFWAMPPQLLGGAAAAAGIAIVNATGNVGGFIGPTLIGALHGVTGNYSSGLLTLTGVLVLEAMLVLCVRVPRLHVAAGGRAI